MVAISKYTKKRKDTIGGIKDIYLMPFVKYNRWEIQSVGLNLTAFPTTTITPFECIGSYTQTSEFENGAILFNQSISFQLNEVYDVMDIQNLLIADYRIIVKTNNNKFLMLGVYNGLKAVVSNNSGTTKSEFNGFKVDFSGKEENPMLLISDLNDLGFAVSETGFNYILNFNID